MTDPETESLIYLVIDERRENTPLRAFRDPIHARNWLIEYVRQREPLHLGEPLEPHLGIGEINMYHITDVPFEDA